MARIWFHKFTVHGKGQFPMDMLRYDQCYPATGTDAAALVPSNPTESRDVTLVHVDSNRYWNPTERRWSSFSWGVRVERGCEAEVV